MSYDIYAVIDAGGSEPVGVGGDWNYTSNCSGMWRKAMPSSDGLAGLHNMNAGQAAILIREGLSRMDADPASYRAMEPPNGWGDFESQREFLRKVADGLAEIPKATVRVSR